MSPPMGSLPMMTLPLTNQINKTSLGSKITAAMSSSSLTSNSMISGTMTVSAPPMESNYINFSQNMFELDTASMDWLQDLSDNQKTEVSSVQVNEPNLAAATSDHAYSAKPREPNKYNANCYNDVEMSDDNKRLSQSADSILVTLLGGGNKTRAVPHRTGVLPRTTKSAYTMNPGYISDTSSSPSSSTMMSSPDYTHSNGYGSMLNGSLLDNTASPLSGMTPFSSDAAVRSDILQSVDSDLLFSTLSDPLSSLPTNANASPPSYNIHSSSFMNRAKSHPNSPSLSPASTSTWPEFSAQRSLSSPSSRCGSHSPETDRNLQRGSMLERFLTTKTPLNPNKGSDDAFPDKHFSKLNIQDTHHRAAADGNLLKQLLTGEIDDQRMKNMEQNLIETRRNHEDECSTPCTPQTPNTPVTSSTPSLQPLSNDMDMLLDFPEANEESLNSLAMGYENDSKNQWGLNMDIPEIQVRK